MFSFIQKITLASTLLTSVAPQALAAGLEIKSFGAGAAGFHVTSHLIMGKSEALLVDAQFTRSEATKLADMIAATGRKLQTVYVTHGHPDHYFGVEVLRKRFPEAHFVTNSEAMADITATGEEKLKAWKPMYKDDLTDTVPQLEVNDANSFKVDGEDVQIMKLAAGESAHAIAVNVPSLKTIIAGDALFDRVHLWLAEGRLDGFLANLSALKKSGAKNFLAGHSVDAKSQSASLIRNNEKYVASFKKALKTSKSVEEVAAKIKKQYPDYQLPIIADIAAKSLFVAKQK